MTFEQFKNTQTNLQQLCDATSAELRCFKRNEIGLTPDNIKFSPEFRELKEKYGKAFKDLRDFNGKYLKQFKTELRNERDNKFNK